jgi:hypothetical protein
MKRLFNKILLFLLSVFGIFLGNICSAENLLEIPKKPAEAATSLPVYLNYVFNVGISVGFFAILTASIISGVYFILSNAMASYRGKAKEWLSGAFVGFLILILLYLIITTIYPPLAFFGTNGPAVKLQEGNFGKDLMHGLYLYEKSSCPTDDAIPVSGNSPNSSFFGEKKIASAKLVQDYQDNNLYVAAAYNATNFYGMCQYINPNAGCQQIQIPAVASVSVYRYSRRPSGDVIIYRKGAGGSSGFDEKGGYLVISAGSIGGLYEEELKNLAFTGKNIGSTNIDDCTVPPEEQDCIKWDKSAKCIQKKCPTLFGKNIGSIEIKGNYWILLGYNWQQKGSSWVSNFCQSYPKLDEVNKVGPKQVKWDAIYTHINYYPQTLTIIPIEAK